MPLDNRSRTARLAALTQSGSYQLLCIVTLSWWSTAAISAAVDVDEPAWQEVEVQLPALPQREDLLPFFVSAASANQFQIDSKSISIASDGVVRYTLVITAPSGASNVSYEGIRCATAERRVYAFGHANGTWSKARSEQWLRISENSLNRHHAELFKTYFCPAGIVIRDADDARRSVRSGGYPAAR